MEEKALAELALGIARLLPVVTRQLFAADDAVAAQLPLAQLRVCGILASGPRSMSELARELNVSLSALTQIADRLERTRLVKRATIGTDRRVRCLQLTGRGEKFMQNRQALLVERVSAVLRQFPNTERRRVLQTFEALLQGCMAANLDQQITERAS